MAANLNIGRNGDGGIVAAWCNDKYFVTAGSMAPGFTTNMDDIPRPPGGNGNTCYTGDSTVSTLKLDLNAFPLNGTYSLLSTDANTNNIGSFTNGAQTGVQGSSDQGKYFSDAERGTFGLPADAGIGISVTGQSIYPVYSNTVQITLESCEVDS
jgi:hypothetical protein